MKAILAACVGLALLGGAPQAAADDLGDALDQPLSFTLKDGMISAEGAFEVDSAIVFLKFLAENGKLTDSWNIPLFIRSPGGALDAAKAIGAMVRSHDMSVVAYDLCASACTYMMMGGVNRVVAKNTRFGVHQFSFEAASAEPDKPFFSANDIAKQQDDVASLHDYADEMGVNPRVVDVASHTRPDGITWLTRQQLVDFRIDNVQSADPEGQEANAITIPGVTEPQVAAGGDISILEALKIHVDKPKIKITSIAAASAIGLTRRVILAETLALPDLENALDKAYGLHVEYNGGLRNGDEVVADKRRKASSWGVRRREIDDSTLNATCDENGISCTVTGEFDSALGVSEGGFVSQSRWRFTCEVMLPLTLPRVTAETMVQVNQ
jgi:hypothetical protein